MGVKRINRILIGIVLGIMIFSMLASAQVLDKKADAEEGGHFETDFGVAFMAEWWYLNGEATLVSSDGEEKDIGFVATFGHQESPLFEGWSHLMTFSGIYLDDNNRDFNCIETFVPRETVGDSIAMHTPYVDYRYPDGLKNLSGSSSKGYVLNYTVNNNMKFDLFFRPDVDNTIDRAVSPLNFTSNERSHGTLKGSIFLNGKNYRVKKSDGYMDHMIPVGDLPWPMYMHGWDWFEVTTDNYQAVAYAVRSLDDSYNNYSFKHLTLISRKNGKVVSEYYGNEITINEEGWIDEIDFNRKRPSKITFSTNDLNVVVNAKSVSYFNRSTPPDITGFVDFMAYEPEGSRISYKGKTEEGSAFNEYLVSDMGIVQT